MNVLVKWICEEKVMDTKNKKRKLAYLFPTTEPALKLGRYAREYAVYMFISTMDIRIIHEIWTRTWYVRKIRILLDGVSEH